MFSYSNPISNLFLSVVENSFVSKKGEERIDRSVHNNAQNAAKASIILISSHLFGDFENFDDFWDENNELIAEHGTIIHGSTPSLADDFLVQELKAIYDVYFQMKEDKTFKNPFAFDKFIPFDRNILRCGFLIDSWMRQKAKNDFYIKCISWTVKGKKAWNVITTSGGPVLDVWTAVSCRSEFFTF